MNYLGMKEEKILSYPLLAAIALTLLPIKMVERNI
jgi:hypothetical protein